MQTVPENGTFIDLTELLKQEEINEKKNVYINLNYLLIIF